MNKKWNELEQRWARENQEMSYAAAVEHYLIENNPRFIEEFSDLCAKTNGRINYEEMQYVLGSSYPKAPWLDKNNHRVQIIQFFREIGIQFKADETHLYFP